MSHIVNIKLQIIFMCTLSTDATEEQKIEFQLIETKCLLVK